MTPLSIGILQGLILAWPVLALAIAFRLFQFPDISVEGSFLVGAATFAMLAQHYCHPAVAIMAGVCSGALVGASSALLHAWFGINKFLSGILVTSACYTLALRLMGSSNIGLLNYPGVFTWADSAQQAAPSLSKDTVSTLLCGMILLGSLGILFIAFRSRMGLKLRAAAVGGRFAVNAGLHHTVGLIAGLALTGAISAFGGALISMRQGFADLSMNQGVLVLALAGLSIGEAVLPAKRLPALALTLLAGVVGSMGYQVIVAFTIRIGFDSADLKIITSIVVVIAVCLRKDRFLSSSE